MSRKLLFGTLMILVILLSACTSGEDIPAEDTGMANPASVFCEENGGRLKIRTDASGGQIGICIFPDGSECEEWAYQRGECSPGDSLSPVPPKFVSSPLQIQASAVPIPYAVLVNTGDQYGITACDRSGQGMGEWQTAMMTGQVHAAGYITDGILSTPLVFWSWNTEQPDLHLDVNSNGNITTLLKITEPTRFTAMIGIPASPVIAWSTIQSGENGALLRSQVYMGEFQSLADVTPVLTLDSRESKYITPLAIRTEDQHPVGIWFTWHLYGIGGTPALFINNYGLYYFDVAANTVYEFLSQDKLFTDLSANQAVAAWVPNGASADIQITDLVNAQTISFPKLPGSERSAGSAVLSPSGTYIAWQEGTGLEPGQNPAITIRVGTREGYIIGEYQHAVLTGTSGLGMDTDIDLLGWLSDEIVLVGVRHSGKDGASAIVAVNVNTNELTLFAEGEFAGFAYP
jgi:putative hemolysin